MCSLSTLCSRTWRSRSRKLYCALIKMNVLHLQLQRQSFAEHRITTRWHDTANIRRTPARHWRLAATQWRRRLPHKALDLSERYARWQRLARCISIPTIQNFSRYTSRLRKDAGMDPGRAYNPQDMKNTVVYAIVLQWPHQGKLILGAPKLTARVDCWYKSIFPFFSHRRVRNFSDITTTCVCTQVAA